jgi:glutaredoxin 3
VGQYKFNNNLPIQNMKNVTIYSTPTCHFCQMAKEYFKANNVAYTEFDVASNSEKRKEMMEKSGQLGVPVILVDDNVVVGFNRPKLAQLLDITNNTATQVA